MQSKDQLPVGDVDPAIELEADLLEVVSRSVITGFVNALAILIFMAQLPELIGGNWMVYAMVAAGLAIIYLFPYINRSIPSQSI